MRKIERQGKVSAHAEVSRNFLQMHYAPFHRAWFIKFSAKTELRQIRMFRERGRERWREREMGKGGGGRGRERQRGRERGEGRVIYTICALFATMFSEKGGSSEETYSGMETVKIHIKTIELGKELNRYYNGTYRTTSPTSRLVPSGTMNLHGHCKCPCHGKSSQHYRHWFPSG